MSLEKRFVKVNGLSSIFNVTSGLLDITSIKQEYTSRITTNSIIFLTATEADVQYGYPDNAKYIWTHNELHPTNDASFIVNSSSGKYLDISVNGYTVAYSVKIVDISTATEKNDGLSSALDIYNNLSNIEEVIAANHTLLANAVGVNADYSVTPWSTASGISSDASTIKAGIEEVASREVIDEKVKVNSSTADELFPLMAVAIADPSDGSTYSAIFDSGMVINASLHSVTFGEGNTASGAYSVAEGLSTTASGLSSHAEGAFTESSGSYINTTENPNDRDGHSAAHAEGYSTSASTFAAHAEGDTTTASGYASHAEGRETVASGNNSHASGQNTTASGNNSHAEGHSTQATETAAHAEGIETRAGNTAAHAEGYHTTANANYSHTEGSHTYTEGQGSHAEGLYTRTISNYSHAEGHYTEANANYSHAEGSHTLANAQSSHAEGLNTSTNGDGSHAEGSGSYTGNSYSHAEGDHTYARGYYSHAEGYRAKSRGGHSHAEGCYTESSGDYSHAEGFYTQTNNDYEHAQGQYNLSHSNTIHSIGIGSDSTRMNAVEVLDSGDVYIIGVGHYEGTDTNDQDSNIKPILEAVVQSDTVLKLWSGTQAQYDAIVTKDNETLYVIKED